MTMDKLAEEIYYKLCQEKIMNWDRKNIVIEAMQSYHETKLKEELIKYDKYIYNHIHTGETSEVFINEYLKQRNNAKSKDS